MCIYMVDYSCGSCALVPGGGVDPTCMCLGLIDVACGRGG